MQPRQRTWRTRDFYKKTGTLPTTSSAAYSRQLGKHFFIKKNFQIVAFVSFSSYIKLWANQ